MIWIARDYQGDNPYRIFGSKPVKAYMVGYDGNVIEDQFTWTLPRKPYIHVSIYDRKKKLLIKTFNEKDLTYGPLSNEENTEISEADSPIYLEPGQGPIEVNLRLTDKMAKPEYKFTGEGI